MDELPLYSLAQALAQQEEIRTKMAALAQREAALNKLIEAIQAYEAVAALQLPIEVGQVAPSDQPKPSSTSKPPSTARRANGRAAPVMEATEKAVGGLLQKMGEPLSTSDLVTLLEDADDLRLPEENPLNVLSARLSNSTKFHGRRGKGWWFVDQPWPGEDNVIPNDNVTKSRPLYGNDPVSDPDNGGLPPNRFAEELGLPSPQNLPGPHSHKEE